MCGLRTFFSWHCPNYDGENPKWHWFIVTKTWVRNTVLFNECNLLTRFKSSLECVLTDCLTPSLYVFEKMIGNLNLEFTGKWRLWKDVVFFRRVMQNTPWNTVFTLRNETNMLTYRIYSKNWDKQRRPDQTAKRLYCLPFVQQVSDISTGSKTDVCLCWGFTAQSTLWGHVDRDQFTSSRKHTYISLTPLNPTFI